jgi:aryl-alcohol dehydrogenase-like predicted oxidoreductase
LRAISAFRVSSIVTVPARVGSRPIAGPRRRKPNPDTKEKQMAETLLARTELGSTGLEITRVGLGAWAIGGAWKFGWGHQDDDESIATIHRALDLGINWIDTAAAYGLGHSEEVVGRALAGLDERPYVFTKCSMVAGPGGTVVDSLDRDSIRREAQASLTRLGVDAIDLYQIHWPRPPQDIEQGWSALVELRDEGLVRHIGVSNFNVDQLERIGAIAPVETLQPPYSLIARGAETDGILPFCEGHDIGVIGYSPMGSGLLTGAMTRERIEALPDDDWRKSSERFREPALSGNLATAERVRAVAERLGVSPGAVAIAWTLRNPAVDGAIVGLRRPDQADELTAGAALELSAADAAELEGSG